MIRDWLRNHRGQVLVEFALTLPLLLLLVVGGVEMGRLAENLLILRQAGYEAVRSAAIGSNETAVRTNVQRLAGTVVKGAGNYSEWLTTDPVTGKNLYHVRYSDDGDDKWVEMSLTPVAEQRNAGDTVAVTISYGYRPLFVGWVLPGPHTLTLTAYGRTEVLP